MRIFLPTSDAYRWACETTCALLEKYWPGHPPVDVVHFQNRPRVPARFNLIDAGKQCACKKWIHQFISYLAASEEKFILLMLDDYALSQKASIEGVARSEALLSSRPSLCGVA